MKTVAQSSSSGNPRSVPVIIVNHTIATQDVFVVQLLILDQQLRVKEPCRLRRFIRQCRPVIVKWSRREPARIVRRTAILVPASMKRIEQEEPAARGIYTRVAEN